MTPSRIALAILLCASCLTACAKTEESSTDVSFSSSTAQAAPAPAPEGTASATAAPAQHAGDTLIARSIAGSDAVSVSLSAGPRVEVVSGGTATTFTGESKETGKRKYYDHSGTQLVEVKPSDTGFKVRTPDGKLLWKVRISDDKIKVSDNEENENAWSLKTGYPDKAKVLDPSEKEVGEVRFADASSPARVRNAAGADVLSIEGGPGSGAWGVLLMEAVPANHRAIIVAELLSRGR